MKKLGELKKGDVDFLGHLVAGEIYFFNPANKRLNPFKARFIKYNTTSEFITIEDLKHFKKKCFHKSFVENIEELRED